MPQTPTPPPPERPDETPATFADLKPPGYWSETLGAFVGVREISQAEFWDRFHEFTEDWPEHLLRGPA